MSKIFDTNNINIGGTAEIYESSTQLYIKNTTSNSEINFKINDSSVYKEALKIASTANIQMQYNGSAAGYLSGTFTVGNGTVTDIVFNNELHDVLSEYNTTTGEYTCKFAGIYQCFATIAWYPFANNCNQRLRVNLNSSIMGESLDKTLTGAGAIQTQYISTTVKATANQVIKFTCNQESGSNKTFIVNGRNNSFSIARIG